MTVTLGIVITVNFSISSLWNLFLYSVLTAIVLRSYLCQISTNILIGKLLFYHWNRPLILGRRKKRSRKQLLEEVFRKRIEITENVFLLDLNFPCKSHFANFSNLRADFPHSQTKGLGGRVGVQSWDHSPVYKKILKVSKHHNLYKSPKLLAKNKALQCGDCYFCRSGLLLRD